MRKMSKKEMVDLAAAVLMELYYEDALSFCRMIFRFAEKTGQAACVQIGHKKEED